MKIRGGMGLTDAWSDLMEPYTNGDLGQTTLANQSLECLYLDTLVTHCILITQISPEYRKIIITRRS